MGELLAVAMSRGSVSSGLSVRARGCSERGGGLSRSCPHGPTSCWTWGTARGLTGLHGQPGLGQYFWTVLPGCHGSADCLEQEITWKWMENKWDNNKFILFCLYFSVYLHINGSDGK